MFSDLPYPGADFFAFEEALTLAEAAKLAEVRAFLAEKVRPVAIDCWNEQRFPIELLDGPGSLAELDIISPVRRLGHSHRFAGLLTAEIHRADASFGTFLSGHDGLFTGSIELLASEEQQAAWLPDIYALRKKGVFAITEPDAGSDVAGGLSTTAELVGDEWVLNGEKRWIGSASFSDFVIVYARDVADGQVKGFLVETTREGFSTTIVEHKIALRAVLNANILLENVRIPSGNKLAHANSFRDVNNVLKDTRATVGWQGVGLQLAAFDLARAYAVERTQFGRQLASFQLIQGQLASMLANLTASTAMMAQLATLQDRGTARGEHTALAKAHVTKLARETVSIARSIFGGNGVDVSYEIGKVFGDAEAIFSYEGTYEINMLIAARSVTGISAFL